MNPLFGSLQPRPRVRDRLTNGTFFWTTLELCCTFLDELVLELANGHTTIHTIIDPSETLGDGMNTKNPMPCLHCSQAPANSLGSTAL